MPGMCGTSLALLTDAAACCAADDLLWLHMSIHSCRYVFVMDPILGTGGSAARAVKVRDQMVCGAQAAPPPVCHEHP